MSRKTSDAERRERREKARAAGWAIVCDNAVLRRLADAVHVGIGVGGESLTGTDAWAVTDAYGRVTVNQERDGEPAEWAWVFAHLLLHLGLGHTDDDTG
ncbi:MAG: hypothetical protein M3422_23660, partial [Actinomycetota bacterium]|nr:hypothetical protein [Actinomycetota bacterium]